MLFLLKLTLTPLFIGLVSLAGRRWGPAVTGWLVGLPLTSGPVIIFLAVEQGEPFGAKAAKATIMGLMSVSAFCLAYARACSRWGWLQSTLAGWGAYLTLTLLVSSSSWSLVVTVLAALISILLALSLFPASEVKNVTASSPRSEIFLRMAAATALVLGLTGAASWLGPNWSGLIAPFPVYSTILAVFTHRAQGGGAAARLLHNVVFASFTFAWFFFVLAGTMVQIGLTSAVTIACTTAVMLHGGLFLRLRRKRLSGDS